MSSKNTNRQNHSYDPNDPDDPRTSFEYDDYGVDPSTDPIPPGFTGLIIGAIVVLVAFIVFLMFGT